MSLVPYKGDSLILNDPTSKSLVIVNPSAGKLSFYQEFDPADSNGNRNRSYIFGSDNDDRRVSSYVCPECGTEINVDDHPVHRTLDTSPNFNLPRKYFKLLQDTHKQQTLTGFDEVHDLHSIIPEELFIPGYFHKFFTTLSLLGNGARGSVFKVVHKIGDTNLGIFAVKKISIGNDMTWFNKCIREVKALSSLTHKSANLITYNHVWLEMDTSYGVTNNENGSEKIPCLFILQQYCPGGNLEDVILNDVFKRFPEKLSPEERKKRFRMMRKHKERGDKIQFGLDSLQTISIIKDIASGLHELHDIGLIHRDLKPSNCLLVTKYDDSENNSNTKNFVKQVFPTVVIGDLGESQMAGESRSATGCTGTLEFTAPEVIITTSSDHAGVGRQSYNEYTFASDMYSLGMIAYFVVFGSLPFPTDDELDEMRKKIKLFRITKDHMIKRHHSLNLNQIDTRIFDIIESLLENDPLKRPTAIELEHNLEKLMMSIGSPISPISPVTPSKPSTPNMVSSRESLEPISDMDNCVEVLEGSGSLTDMIVFPTPKWEERKSLYLAKRVPPRSISVMVQKIKILGLVILNSTLLNKYRILTYICLFLMGYAFKATAKEKHRTLYILYGISFTNFLLYLYF